MNSGLIMIVAMIGIVVGYVSGAVVTSILLKKKAQEQTGEASFNPPMPDKTSTDSAPPGIPPPTQAAVPMMSVNLEPSATQVVPGGLTGVIPAQPVPSSPVGAVKASSYPIRVKPVASTFQPVTAPPEKNGTPSIVAQINDILQAQVKGTPLEMRGIRLVESPLHGVTVWIGLNSYPCLESIPDMEVNDAIKAAVKTWEARK